MPRTTSHGSALLPPSPRLALPHQRISLPLRIAKRFSIFTCIHDVSPRKRGDALPTIRTSFSFLAVVSFRPAWRSLCQFLCLIFFLRVSLSFLRFFHRSAPEGPYESFNSIFPDSTLRTFLATRDDALSFEIHLYSKTHPGPDSIFLLLRDYPKYVQFELVYIYYLSYLSQEAARAQWAQFVFHKCL